TRSAISNPENEFAATSRNRDRGLRRVRSATCCALPDPPRLEQRARRRSVDEVALIEEASSVEGRGLGCATRRTRSAISNPENEFAATSRNRARDLRRVRSATGCALPDPPRLEQRA